MESPDLSDSLNSLQKTGKSFRSFNTSDSKSRFAAHTKVCNSLPNAIEKFHLAVDVLECEILQSKAALLDELELLKLNQQSHDSAYLVDDTNKSTADGINGSIMDGDKTNPEKENIASMAQDSLKVPYSEPSELTATDPAQTFHDRNNDLPAVIDSPSQSSKSQVLKMENHSTKLEIKNEEPMALSLKTETFQEISMDSLFEISPQEVINIISDSGHGEIGIDSKPLAVETQIKNPSYNQNSSFGHPNLESIPQFFDMANLHTTADFSKSITNGNEQVLLHDQNINISTQNLPPDMDGMTTPDDNLFDDLFFGDDTEDINEI
ncbi:unnamed protein product [Blumeria hordei]|uniref:Uncharacterized protein n=1 Tax=Blumeria hordei TaxID=2867405 RepID=A0A383UPY7_BLUHO|nr:unnamed protein product [Blumeria hordei]